MRALDQIAYVVALAAACLLIAIALAGCGSGQPVEAAPVVPVVPAACEIMRPHLPQTVRRQDTQQTKIDALHRNEAWGHACPALRGTQ